MALLGAVACARRPPEEIADANAAVERARSACAPQYAPAALDQAGMALGELNALADARKFGKASEAAPRVVALADRAASAAGEARDQARAEAAAAVRRAEAAIDEAERAQAASRAGGDLLAARSRLEEARRLAGTPCESSRARDAARAAADLAGAAREQAVATRRRAEDEARRLSEAEGRRRLDEEEARRSQEPPALPESYTVGAGDTLWRIAQESRQYGDASHWPLIFRANRSQIKDPDRIYPSQTLKIPRNVPAAEVDASVREAQRRKPGGSPLPSGQ